MLNDSDKFNGFILLNDEYKGVFFSYRYIHTLLYNYWCPVKLFETIRIRAEYLAWYSALVVTFAFSQ